MTRMKELARSFVWWPCIDKDLEERVKTCDLASFPGLRPDFISQPWRKIGRRPGAIYHVMSAAVYVTVKQEVSYDLTLSTYIIRNAWRS